VVWHSVFSLSLCGGSWHVVARPWRTAAERVGEGVPHGGETDEGGGEDEDVDQREDEAEEPRRLGSELHALERGVEHDVHGRREGDHVDVDEGHHLRGRVGRWNSGSRERGDGMRLCERATM
jgi:hypothetical protein